MSRLAWGVEPESRAQTQGRSERTLLCETHADRNKPTRHVGTNTLGQRPSTSRCDTQDDHHSPPTSLTAILQETIWLGEGEGEVLVRRKGRLWLGEGEGEVMVRGGRGYVRRGGGRGYG